MMKELHLESYAKVNLRLEILKKREDGYHELRTIFQQVDLHDTLHFSLKKGKGISITTDHPDLPLGKKNLVDRAVRSLLKRSNYQGGVCIKIDKRIPIGAGLGGGSSNAATTLKAFDRLLEMNLPQKELMKIGVEIGADVPFFFKGGAAIGSGIGERLRQITLPKFWFILIYPNFEVSTRWAYQNFKFPILNAQTSDVEERMRKERSGANLIISHRFSSGVEGLTKRQFHINLHKFLYTPKRISRLLWNDLEGIVSKKYPQINAMKKMLYAVGAVGALMTGSGPTVFGIFPDKRESLEAYKRVKKMVGGRGWLILNTHSISA